MPHIPSNKNLESFGQFWGGFPDPKAEFWGVLTLEVQPPFFIGWFPNHHSFSRSLSSSKGTTIFKMMVDFQG